MGKSKDDLGTRMKGYEAAFKYKLLRRGYTMIRIDGKAFHTYTKGLKRPFDQGLIDDMDTTAAYLCKEIQGAVCAFVQSDEISILICDFEKNETSAWFDNVIQKMCSVSASMATARFNKAIIERFIEEGWTTLIRIRDMKWAEFDSRVYQLPTTTEVENYYIWRQQDTVKNSISSVAQSMFSHKELNGKNGNEKQEMMFQKDGTNWNDFDPKLKRGRMIVKETYEKMPDVFRTRWVSIAPPTFTQDREYLDELIPNRERTYEYQD
jgi:tRNA(His) 5'-end guanylyltransferase